MHIRSLLIVLCILVMLLCACMPMPQYIKVQTDLEETRIQRDLAQKELESLKDKHEQTEVLLQWT